ncbi:hypothetical protein [Enterobacter roggenkampii]|uniref:hypothetical protein n=1 Tax=Enterobacter roggenkampii TaxID=1812935 RepID=UPI001F28B5CA|nr:hypothetical protein [Enterobacter roggenkampii]
MKHTPGPWSVNVIGQHWNNKSLKHIEVTFGQDGECICDTVYNPSDANLIAAAPDLLEALQNATRVLEAGKNVKFPDWIETIQKSKAAISKALGEE